MKSTTSKTAMRKGIMNALHRNIIKMLKDGYTDKEIRKEVNLSVSQIRRLAAIGR